MIPFGDSGYVGNYRFEPERDVVYLLAFRYEKKLGIDQYVYLHGAISVALNKEATLLRALNNRFHRRIFQVLTGRITGIRASDSYYPNGRNVA